MHLFFIQLDPDIDYIAPIVYKLAKSDANNVMVICFNPLHNISNDYRLQYLINDLNVRIMHLHQINKIINLVCSPVFWMIRALPIDIREKFHARITAIIIKKKWFELFLQRLNPYSITVDEVIPNHAKFIVDLANNINSTTIVVPTGVNILNDTEIVVNNSGCYFDYKIVAPNTIPSQNTEEIGVLLRMNFPRYSEEWQGINKKLLNSIKDKYPLPDEMGKLKIVIFGRPQIKFENDHSLVKKIARESNITLVFKGKPRALKGGEYDKYPSALLIRWADVVITSITSVILDILYYKKIFIYPKYLAPNDYAEFEDYNICLNVKTEDELMDTLGKILEDRKYGKNKEKRVNEYYNSMVYINQQKVALAEFAAFYKTLTFNSK